jgi:hypothetical protein
MNYTELVSRIKSYVENDFTTADVNTFIRQAEQRIYNSVQFPSLRKNVTGLMTAGNQYLSAPGDFLAVYSFAVIDSTGNYHYLLNKDVNFIRAMYPNTNELGRPEYYSLFGPTTTNDTPPTITNELTFLLGPVPNQNYSVELHYYYYPTSIVITGTSWLGDNFDSVLLYGSLLEAYTYMKGEQDVIAQYQKRYDDAMALAKRLGDGMERGDAYRDGQVKLPVM